MYVLWVRRLKQLKRGLRRCLQWEKENEGNEFYQDMKEFRRDFALPLFRFYDRLNGQTFIRFTDEEQFYRMLDEALRRFKDLIDCYSSVPPEAPVSVPLSEV